MQRLGSITNIEFPNAPAMGQVAGDRFTPIDTDTAVTGTHP